MIDIGRPSCFGEQSPITLFFKGLYTFPTNDVVYIIFWPWRPVKHFKTLFWIKAAQPENIFSLEVFLLYISNLCQPQKVSNKVTFSGSKGAASYNKERTN